jgi:hypothetical protein
MIQLTLQHFFAVVCQQLLVKEALLHTSFDPMLRAEFDWTE